MLQPLNNVRCLSLLQIPSEVQSLFQDDKAAGNSMCDEVFWVLVRALKKFVEREGGGYLPLSGSLPDMHTDTKSFVQLQTLYK